MVDSFIEREAKFDAPATFAVPDVTGLLPVGGTIERSVEKLRSDYVDTADRALLRARMTLRRRTGTTDNGWQLKVPAGSFREEIRVEQTATDVPAEVAVLLTGIGRGQPLVPLASIVTTRSVTRLLDADGVSLAEVDDDAVRAWPAERPSSELAWRELEVELAHGRPALLRSLGKCLLAAGATPSASASKLGQVLAVPSGSDRAPSTVGEVAAGYIAEQQWAILAGDLALRRGTESVIHPTRVATRRLRSTLRVFADLYDESRASALDGELRWLAATLGEVRDRQVLRKRLDAMLTEETGPRAAGLVTGLAAGIDAELTREHDAAWSTLREALVGARYLALLGDLDAWVRQPPWSGRQTRGPRRVRTYVAHAEAQVATRLRAGNRSGDLDQLHRARKAAKRARYTAEAAAVVTGKATRHAKKYQQLQDLLGEHQDAVVSADWLRGQAAAGPAEHAFGLGILYEREQLKASQARHRAQKVAKTYTS